MRHAAVPIHLMAQAHPATPAQARHDAPPDQPRRRRARRRRLATVARRVRPA